MELIHQHDHFNTIATPMNTPTNQDIIFGDREVAVTKLDGSTATIIVKQVPFSQIRAYQKAENADDDGLSILRMVTGLDQSALSEISAASMFALLDASEAVNGPLARKSEARETAKTMRTMESMKTQYPELFAEAMQRAKEKMEGAIKTAGLQSSASSPTSSPAQA